MHSRHTLALAAAAVFTFVSGACQAQNITVNTVEDQVDFGGAQTVANLPGPDGLVSFREAVTAANNTPGPQTIAFSIPKATFWLVNNMALLKVGSAPGGFSLTDDGTTVDFTTQTAAIGDTNPSGNEVGIFSLMSNFTLPQAGITISGNNCTVRGLDMVQNFGYGIRITGNNNHVQGCHISMPLNGLVYAAVAIRPVTTTPPTGNVIEGNTLACNPGVGLEITGPAKDNVVIGNTLTQSHTAGLYIQAAANGTRVGGTTAGERNLIAGNGGAGGSGIPEDRDLFMDSVDGTRIMNNYFGTNAAGTAAATPPAIGIEMHACTNTQILNNVISGYLFEILHHGITPVRTGTAIYVSTGVGGVKSTGTVIQGNRIGVSFNGVTPLPNAEGVHVESDFASPMSVLIGGGFGQGNIIANNGSGIIVRDGATGVRVSRNSIYSNGTPDTLFPAGGLGIDLVGSSGVTGVTPNDAFDTDDGANMLQNFPTISSSVRVNGATTIQGKLSTSPSKAFVIQFYATPLPNHSGFGEGKTYLGSVNVTTNSSGVASFSVSLPDSNTKTHYVTATATESATGNTSEFSKARLVS